MRKNCLVVIDIVIAIVIGLGILPSKTYAVNKLSFIHSDHLGSTSLITDEQGNVVSQKVYYPYGATRQKLKAEGLKLTAREYTGQVSDQDQTGLYYYNARYYNPAVAKFTQADTIQRLNRYSYVSGNPIIHVDPSGHEGKVMPMEDQAIGWQASGCPYGNPNQCTDYYNRLNTGPEVTWMDLTPEQKAMTAIIPPALAVAIPLVIYAAPGIISSAGTAIGTAATAAQQAIKMKIFERFGNSELSQAVRMFQRGQHVESLEEAERVAKNTYSFFQQFRYVNANELPPGAVGGWNRMFEEIRFLKNLSTSKIPAIHEVSHMIDDVLLRAGRQNTFTAEGQLGGYSYTTKEYLRSIISTELKAYLGCWASGRLSFAQTVKYFWQTSLNGTEGLSTLQVLLKASGITK